MYVTGLGSYRVIGFGINYINYIELGFYHNFKVTENIRLNNTITCRWSRVKKITGSSSDVWIY
jgi:hypothetical protein